MIWHQLQMCFDLWMLEAKSSKGVEMYIAAASSEVEETSRLQGDWQVLVDAGVAVAEWVWAMRGVG